MQQSPLGNEDLENIWTSFWGLCLLSLSHRPWRVSLPPFSLTQSPASLCLGRPHCRKVAAGKPAFLCIICWVLLLYPLVWMEYLMLYWGTKQWLTWTLEIKELALMLRIIFKRNLTKQSSPKYVSSRVAILYMNDWLGGLRILEILGFRFEISKASKIQKKKAV